MPKNSLELSCPAKVNLALSVGPPDHDGMHPLASWMVAVNFGDHLTLTAAQEVSRFDIAFDCAAPAPGAIDWPLEKDLTFRAHKLLEQHLGRALPVDAVLRKRIPTGAGLGGGSSDAAAMMVGLNRLFDLKRDTQTLVTLSGALGSDVGFLIAALCGTPSAIVTGKGERLEAQTPIEITPLVLIFPPFGCPTAQVYKTLDAQRAGLDVSHLPDVARVRALATASPVPQDAPFNDLAAPACAVQPRLGEMLAELRAKLALPVHVTGSGAAMFVIAPTAITARVLAHKVTALTGLPAVATRTL